MMRRVFVLILLACALPAQAQNVSPAPILQWFEASWDTMERRAPDVFMAGYSSIWTPPPGRALDTAEGGLIGYDVYDRFDLGAPGDPTLYGTETGYKTMIDTVQRFGGSVHVDFVHHHVGSFDVFPGNSPGPYAESIHDYPGFVLSNPGTQDGDTYMDPPPAPPGHPAFEYQFRLARLITLNHTASNALTFVRNPVPGFADNVPTSNMQNMLGRIANLPDERNRRYYPDQDLPGMVIDDPHLGDFDITVHPFNLDDPAAGDPTAESVSGYMMRYAQWLVQVVGVDGLRVDAARHVPLGAENDPYNPTQVDVPALIDRAVFNASLRENLDGSRRQVFQFQEVFNGDPDFLQQFVRKDLDPSQPDQVGADRDVLDFPMWFAMRENLSNNGFANNWYNIRNASQDNRDDGLANNGSQSIGFVNNHDEGGVHLSNVAHAWILMRPGNAYVYFRGNEFDRSAYPDLFLKDGRGDALGGQFGEIVTDLVKLRTTHGRGDFIERWIDGGGFSNLYAFERDKSVLVGLNSRLDEGFDERVNVQTNFAPGTLLLEMTGNAADAQVDAGDDIPEVLTVDQNGQVTLRIPRNKAFGGFEHNRGYVIYGLAAPQGELTLTNVASVIPGQTPTPQTNTTARLTDIDVVTSDQFDVRVETMPVSLLGNPALRDRDADGDFGVVKIDEGIDLNGNGIVDHVAPNTVLTGFENFDVHNPGYFDADGEGLYVQPVDATQLSEGMHFVEARVFRHRDDGGAAIFESFRKVVYVDRLKPDAQVLGFEPTLNGIDEHRDLLVHSTDKTADSVHVLMNLGEAVSEEQILTMATGQGAEAIDRDLFLQSVSNVPHGNNVATVVTREISGNYNIQRTTGLFTDTPIGAGLGDLNFDGSFTPEDIAGVDGAFEQVLYSQNMLFNPAADLNADGRVDTHDLLLLDDVITDPATLNEVEAVKFRRTDFDSDGQRDGADIDQLVGAFGSDAWLYDLTVDGVVNFDDLTLMVFDFLDTRFGDANLDGKVGIADLAVLSENFGLESGWAAADFNADGMTTIADLALLSENFGFDRSFSATHTATNPTPTSLPVLLVMLAAVGSRRHRR